MPRICPRPTSPSTRTLALLLGLSVVLAGMLLARAARADAFASCTTSAAPSTAAEGFEKRRYRAFLAGVDPGHSAQDVIVAQGERAWLEGKFAYGDASKDLEEEPVRAWLDVCSAQRELGRALTDDDGRAQVSVATDDLAAGTYRVTWGVIGDGSTVTSDLHVWPVGTRVVVFDIDATLTVGDGELVKLTLDGSNWPVLRDGAVELVEAYARAGYEIVYLTGRTYLYLEHTRAWLAANGLPTGAVRTADYVSQSMPGNGAVGAFKAEQLAAWRDAGFEIVAAYGNASTDVWAYGEAGIPGDRTWIIGGGGSALTVGDWGANRVDTDDWSAHLAGLELAPADQPWE